MIVGQYLIKLFLPEVNSLKEKRSILKSMISKIRNKFNVSIAEVDLFDIHRSSLLGISAVGVCTSSLDSLIDNIIKYIRIHYPYVSIEHTIREYTSINFESNSEY